MSSMSNYLENGLTDMLRRGKPFVIGANQYQCVATATAPAVVTPTTYWGLLNVKMWVPSWSPTVGDFTVKPDSAGTLHLLKATTVASATGTSWPSVAIANDGTVTDGGVTWTDQYTALEAGIAANLPAEFSGGSYARAATVLDDTVWNNTQAAGGTAASTGTNGTTANLSTLTYTSMPAGNAGLYIEYDAATGGNQWDYCFVTSGPVAVSAGANLTSPAGSLTIQIDN